jgi:hypothetical protein
MINNRVMPKLSLFSSINKWPEPLKFGRSAEIGRNWIDIVMIRKSTSRSRATILYIHTSHFSHQDEYLNGQHLRNKMFRIRPVLRLPTTTGCDRAVIVANRSIHSTAARQFPRSTRGRNPNRGVSPMRRRPQKERLGAQKYGIPAPNLGESRRTQPKSDDTHGLWGFFRDKKAIVTPDEDHKHGSNLFYDSHQLRHSS